MTDSFTARSEQNLQSIKSHAGRFIALIQIKPGPIKRPEFMWPETGTAYVIRRFCSLLLTCQALTQIMARAGPRFYGDLTAIGDGRPRQSGVWFHAHHSRSAPDDSIVTLHQVFP